MVSVCERVGSNYFECGDSFKLWLIIDYYYYYYSSYMWRPFKVAYSGALPAQPRSNNVVLRPERNRAEWLTGVRRSATGRPFKAVGLATEKVQCRRITDLLLCSYRLWIATEKSFKIHVF